jgi:uncharacterized protein (TIGR03067 family)
VATSLLVGLALAVGAPIKGTPKPDEALIGEWVVTRTVIAGMELATEPDQEFFTFTPDGKMTTVRFKHPPETGTYKLDTKSDPPRIDMVGQKGKLAREPRMYGVFKVDGDTLSIAFDFEEKNRPAKVEAAKGSDAMLLVLKRAKKK